MVLRSRFLRRWQAQSRRPLRRRALIGEVGRVVAVTRLSNHVAARKLLACELGASSRLDFHHDL